MRLRVLAPVIAIVLGVTALAGCSSSKKNTTTETTAGGGGGGVTVPGGSSSSGTTVQVTVSDTKGLSGPMTLVVSPASVPAGDVTFQVKNTGTIDHEVVLLNESGAFDKLTVTSDTVSEKNNIGETGDPPLKPGESRSFTVKGLKAGSHILVCNIEKHYADGMRAQFTVQ